MKVKFTTLILILVSCNHCTIMILSASNEDNQNRPPKHKIHLSIECRLESEKREIASTERQKNRKGKGLAVEGSSSQAETSTRGKSMENVKWTNEQNEELLRYFYGFQKLGMHTKTGFSRDWNMIFFAWEKKYWNFDKIRMKSHAFFLRDKLLLAARQFDVDHPIGNGKIWPDWLNDDFMKIYYATENRDKLKHGEAMYAEWMRMGFSAYQDVNPEYLIKRAEKLLQSVRKTTAADLYGSQYYGRAILITV